MAKAETTPGVTGIQKKGTYSVRLEAGGKTWAVISPANTVHQGGFNSIDAAKGVMSQLNHPK
jgi:hypothetical protein